MAQDITIQKLADAFNIGRYQIDAWISRGYLVPQNECERGKARIFTMPDAITLGVIVDFARLGFEPARVAPHIGNLHGVADGDALLVIYEGPIRLSSQEDAAFMDSDIPAPASRIISPQRLPEIAADPEVRSFAVVNLNDIERRVTKALSAD